MTSESSNTAESEKHQPSTAEAGADEDVFHDARYPAEEEAVSFGVLLHLLEITAAGQF